ncbi:hypothetical protein ACFSJY_09495 [Thalassotalea euphylliae]|uniref:hypothetical protein n=1 Tax=Thalassotalea euphylliae TaxID=1655234 RepID=UPI00362533E9
MSAENVKAPSQVFRWFEKMKSNYEQSIKAVLNRFEQYNEKQQARLDASHLEHVNNLKDAHHQLHNQQQATIARLEADIAHYKQQVAQQQQTIEQLNNRYDAVITTFLSAKKTADDVLDISAEYSENQAITQPAALKGDSNETAVDKNSSEDNITEDIAAQGSVPAKDDCRPNKDITITVKESSAENDLEAVHQEAILLRTTENFDEAIPLFMEAAKQGCNKSMGALGRAYFLAEGVEQDPLSGLAWLIKAAEADLLQAKDKVSAYQTAEPEMYKQALKLSESLIS